MISFASRCDSQDSLLEYHGIKSELNSVLPEPETDIDTLAHAINFVISMNLHRRHMNESQRGMVAAKLARLKRGVTYKSVLPIGRTLSADRAAKLLHVGVATVGRAKFIQKKGIPSLLPLDTRSEWAYKGGD